MDSLSMMPNGLSWDDAPPWASCVGHHDFVDGDMWLEGLWVGARVQSTKGIVFCTWLPERVVKDKYFRVRFTRPD